jgi:DNA transposition AAA+ family ATPase
MLIFDEAERLSMTALELIRDIFDRTGVGIILISMPGMEKRLALSAILQPRRIRPSLSGLDG